MIVVLGAIVLAGAGAIGLVLYAPTASVPTATSIIEAGTGAPTTDQTMSSTSTFNTTVLQRTDYTALDLGMISQGRLPVLPPTGTGKPNPFQ